MPRKTVGPTDDIFINLCVCVEIDGLQIVIMNLLTFSCPKHRKLSWCVLLYMAMSYNFKWRLICNLILCYLILSSCFGFLFNKALIPNWVLFLIQNLILNSVKQTVALTSSCISGSRTKMVEDKMVRTKWYGHNGTDKMAPIESSIDQAIQFPLTIWFFSLIRLPLRAI